MDTGTKQQDRFRDSLRVLVNMPEGRLVLKTILDACNTESSVFSEKEAIRDFYLGKQSVGFQLAQAIRDLEPRAYPKFLIDCEDDNERYNRESESNNE